MNDGTKQDRIGCLVTLGFGLAIGILVIRGFWAFPARQLRHVQQGMTMQQVEVIAGRSYKVVRSPKWPDEVFWDYTRPSATRTRKQWHGDTVTPYGTAGDWSVGVIGIGLSICCTAALNERDDYGTLDQTVRTVRLVCIWLHLSGRGARYRNAPLQLVYQLTLMNDGSDESQNTPSQGVPRPARQP